MHPYLNEKMIGVNNFSRLFLYSLMVNLSNKLDLNKVNHRFDLLKMICKETKSSEIWIKKLLTLNLLETIAKQSLKSGKSEWIYFIDLSISCNLEIKQWEKEKFTGLVGESDFDDIFEIFTQNMAHLKFYGQIYCYTFKLLVNSVRTIESMEKILKFRLHIKEAQSKIDGKKLEISFYEVQEFSPLLTDACEQFLRKIEINNWKKTFSLFEKIVHLKSDMLNSLMKKRIISSLFQNNKVDLDFLGFLLEEVSKIQQNSYTYLKELLESASKYLILSPVYLNEKLAVISRNIDKKEIVGIFVKCLRVFLEKSWKNNIKIEEWYLVFDEICKFDHIKEHLKDFVAYHGSYFEKFTNKEIFSFSVNSSNLSTLSKKCFSEKVLEKINSFRNFEEMFDNFLIFKNRIAENSFEEIFALETLSLKLVKFQDMQTLLERQSPFWIELFIKIDPKKVTSKMKKTTSFQEAKSNILNLINTFVSGEIQLSKVLTYQRSYQTWKDLMLIIPTHADVFDKAIEKINTYRGNKTSLKTFIDFYCGSTLVDWQKLQNHIKKIDPEDKITISDIQNPNFFGPLFILLPVALKFSQKTENITFLNFFESKKKGTTSSELSQEIESIYKEYSRIISSFENPNNPQTLKSLHLFWKNITSAQLAKQIEILEKDLSIKIPINTVAALESFCTYKDYLDQAKQLILLVKLFGVPNKQDYNFENLQKFVEISSNTNSNIYDLHSPLYILKHNCFSIIESNNSKIFIQNLCRSPRLISWLKENYRKKINEIFLSFDELSDQYLSSR